MRAPKSDMHSKRALCPHGKTFTYCVKCGGGMVCRLCSKRKDRCSHHAGSELCIKHKRRKQRCAICHPELAAAQKMRDQCGRVMRKLRVTKNDSSTTMLGCTVSEFREAMEVKMAWWNARYQPQMRWSSIHLDHIKPVHTLLSRERRGVRQRQKQICCIAHYTNIQPLPPIVNLLKKSTWNAEDDMQWHACVCGNPAFAEIFLPASVWVKVKAMQHEKDA